MTFCEISFKEKPIRLHSRPMISHCIVRALDIGIWKSSNAPHGNAKYPGVHATCRLVFIAIVYMRSRCVGNLVDIDLFNLIPRKFPDNAVYSFVARCKNITTRASFNKRSSFSFFFFFLL